MGDVQTYHWAALFPDYVEPAAPICSSARISRHSYVFLKGMRSILTADPAWAQGNYNTQPLVGLRTMARAWAAWPPPPHFYRHECYKQLGFTSLDDYLERSREAFYCRMDPNNLLTQIATWQSSDISNNDLYDGDFDRALAVISAKTFVMPCINDAYSLFEDSELEVSKMTNALLRPIPSGWGHWAGSGRNPEDTAFIDRQLQELLAAQDHPWISLQ